MTRRHFASLINFHALFLIPFGAVLFFLAFFFGCQKAEEPKQAAKPVVTTDNLQTAYGKEARRAKMYSLFVKQAEKERNRNMAGLYRAITRSEEIHARNHSDLLKTLGAEPVSQPEEPIVVGTIPQTLKMALSSEELEYDAMYPNLIRSANAEKCTLASVQFARTRDADARHGELVREAANTDGKIPAVKYFVCPECGYVITSDKTEECPVCQTKKGLFEKI
jgi:rubrerythrin